MKTNLFSIILFSLTVVVLASCSQKDNVVIGISLGPNQERWQKDLDLMTERLEYSGAKVLIKEAQNDETLQAEQIEDLLKNKIDVLIVAPVNSETCGVIIKEAKQKDPDLKVIAYDRIIKDCDLDFYVSFDNIKVGELQADYLTRIKPKGKYAILGGSPKDNNSQLLKLGQMNILQPLITKGDITIVLDKFVDDWNADNAYKIVNEYLSKGNELDAIVASSDEIAKGASKALEEHNMTKNVLLSGQDAQADACKRINKGKQTMTVYKYIESLANTTANIAMLMARNEPIPNSFVTMNNGDVMVPAILLPSMIQVHKGNIRMTVIADGYLDRNEVFGDAE